MMRRLTFLLPLFGALSQPVRSQELPDWKIADICAREPAQCTQFEARARQAVGAGWSVLPETYRRACLSEIKTPLDQSWRLLSQCLELQALKGLDKDAIATSATPAEPLPKVIAPPSEPAGIPPPPFGVPTSPPKVD